MWRTPPVSARQLSLNALWALTNQVFARGSIILASMLLARMLDTQAFAAFTYFNLTVSMLSTYAVMGLGISASRFFAAIDNVVTPEVARLVTAIALITLASATIGFSLVMVMPTEWISAGLHVPRWLLGLGLFSLTLQSMTAGAILGLEKYRLAAVFSLIGAMVVLSGALCGGIQNSATLAMGAYIAAAMIQVVGNIAIIGHSLDWTHLGKGLELRWGDLRQVLSLTGPIFLTSIIASSGSWIVGRLILSGESGDFEFALFSIGLHWFSLGLVLPGMVSRVLLPRMVRMANAASTPDAICRLTRTGVAMATVSSLLVMLVGVTAGPLILAAYGEIYKNDRWFLVAFLAAATVAAPVNTLGNALIASDGQVKWLCLTCMWLGVLVVVSFINVDSGAWAGVLAYMTAYITLAAAATLLAKRKALI